MKPFTEEKKNTADINAVKSLQKDATSLFEGRKSSHMGHWYYGSLTDPSGANLWSKIAEKKGGPAALSKEEHLILLFSLSPVARNLLGRVRTVCDLGPGSRHAVERKAFPLLSLSDELQTYTAVDFSEALGAEAVTTVSQKKNISAHWRQSHVFETDWTISLQPSDLVLAFGMLDNIIAPAGVAPDGNLVGFLRTARANLNRGGAFIASFCTEMDGSRVLKGYLDEVNQDFCLGTIRRIARELPVSGMFDPAVWCYAPEWHAAAGQCAHTVYPTLDQNFRIGDRAFSIKAGQKFHLSNSYRYTPAQIRACAAAAGFAKINILQHGTAALLVAQNGLSVATAPASSALLQN